MVALSLGIRFGTGSIPTSDRSAYPSKAELLTALEDAKLRIAGRLTALSDPGMGAMLPDERHAVFPTVGHAVVHILVGHFAVHVGQLSPIASRSRLPSHQQRGYLELSNDIQPIPTFSERHDEIN